METLYRKVAVFERMPEEIGTYMCMVGSGQLGNYDFLGDKFESSVVKYWFESVPNTTTQLQADKEELIGNHFKLFRRLNSLVNRYKLGGFEDLLEKSKEINRKHSEGGLNIVQSNP